MPPFLLSNLKSRVSRLPLGDTDQYGGVPLAFVREDIIAKHVSSESTPIESIYIGLNFPKKNWLLCCAYNPDKILQTM